MKREMLGKIVVNSGHLMIVDSGHLDKFKMEADEFLEEVEKPYKKNKHGAYPYSFWGALSAIQNSNKGGALSDEKFYNATEKAVAVAVQSGLGDGVFPVYASYSDTPEHGKKVTKIEIVFNEGRDF